MHVEEAHREFIRDHLEKRSGERRGRLERGHKEAEALFCRSVWWPLQGNFEGLHPEYEVTDWRGMSYFCDFVWLTPFLKLAIEIKGFGPHVRDMDRQKYCNELNRETFLTALGFQVVSLAYDDVQQRPELCITLLKLVLSRFLPKEAPRGGVTVRERELIRLACRLGGKLRPRDAAEHLELNHRTAVQTLKELCEKGLFVPEGSLAGKRVVRYQLQAMAVSYL
ncbi:MAG: hypothetical protein K0Q90_3360 [Paenibacillaceae bacterium]|jgi:hypothetical protein|nr:hypothetical protein [Paenibacillaceae bacterium]